MTRLLRTALVAALVLAAAAAHAQTALKLAYPAWDSKAQEEAVTGMLREFEKQNAGITVEVVSIPFSAMRQRLVVSARSNDAPDLAYVDGRWIPEMAAVRFLADITARAAKLDRPDWYEAPWQGATLGGKVYGVPDRVDPWMVYYNTDHFQQAGIAQFPRTMEDFVAAGKKLTHDGQYAWGLLGAKDASLISRYLNFHYAFGANVLSDDGKRSAMTTPQAIEALAFYGDMLNKYHMAQPSALANGQNDIRQLFQAGRVSMIIDGPWLRGTLRDQAPNLKWDMAEIPAGSPSGPRFLTSSWYYALFESGKNKEAAWKLVEFLTRPENMARGVVTLPARKSAAAKPRFATAEYKTMVEALPHAVPFPVTDHFSEVADAVGDAVQQVLAQKSTAKEAAEAVSRRIDKIVAQ